MVRALGLSMEGEDQQVLRNSASWVENSLEDNISRFGVKAFTVHELVWETGKKKRNKKGRFRG